MENPSFLPVYRRWITLGLGACTVTEHRRAAAETPPEPTRGRGRLWLLLLIVLAVSAYGLYQSPVLRFQGAEVVGVKRLSARRVLEAAEIAPGAPRWEHPSYRIEERLLKEPWIESATAEWTWNRLQIKVTERTAIALLPYQGKWVLLDHTGMILELVDSPAGQKLPVISGVATGKALRGQQLMHEGLGDALYVLSWMAAPYASQISEVNVKPDGQLFFFMVGGAQVEWGGVSRESKTRQDSVRKKIELFAEVWSGLTKRTAPCSIDMRPAEGLFTKGCK